MPNDPIDPRSTCRSEAAESPDALASPSAPSASSARLQRDLIGAWWLTEHAIDRWLQRYSPGVERHDAFRQLARISEDALEVTAARRDDGKRVFVHADWPAARFVVADDGERPLPTLVSILDAVPSGTRRGMFRRERRSGEPGRRDGSTWRRGGRERG